MMVVDKVAKVDCHLKAGAEEVCMAAGSSPARISV